MRAIGLALALPVAGTAQDPGAALAALVEAPCFAGARVGVLVVDLESGRALAEHDADSGFMTASNMKLISSATALLTLGPERRFRTTLATAGTIEGSVLRGDLCLRGDGDPTLGGPHEPSPDAPFARFAARLLQLGIREITGDVLGDDDCQPDDELLGEGWSWGYETEPYAAPMSGLCFAECCVDVVLTPAGAGEPPVARLWPATGLLSLENEALCTDDGRPSGLRVERRRASSRIVVRGTLASGSATHVVKVSVDNPTAYAAGALRQTLERAGIRVLGSARDADDVPGRAGAAARVLAEHASPPVLEILTRLNKASQNLYAEQLLRAASRHATGRGDMEAAAAHAAATLRGLGVDTTGLVIADGSGLTRLNLVRPRQLATLLAALWQSPHRDAFVATLPIAGVDGTLERRFRGTPAQGRVRAKTGYIARVVALSGYVPRTDPRRAPLVFAILTNNFTCEPDAAKAAVDAFVDQLARHAGFAAPG